MTTKTSKPAAKKKRERIVDAMPVYFAGTTGNIAIESEGYQWVNPTHREKVAGLSLDFGEKGVTRPYDPSYAPDAEIIKRVRAWIAEGRDERITRFNIREVSPIHAAMPFAKWHDLKTDRVVEMVRDGGYDIRECIIYEERQAEPREDLLNALDDLLNEDVEEDPLSVPEL